jgi:hypothetical protein
MELISNSKHALDTWLLTVANGLVSPAGVTSKVLVLLNHLCEQFGPNHEAICAANWAILLGKMQLPA